MIDLSSLPRLTPMVYPNAAAGLVKLRRELEATGDWPGLETPAVLLLADVCQALGLSDADRQAVLGAEGAAYVEAVTKASLYLA